MCGICGHLHTNSMRPIDWKLLRRMNETLYHRGPDSDGMYVNSNGGLAKVWQLYDAVLATGAFRLLRAYSRYDVYERVR